MDREILFRAKSIEDDTNGDTMIDCKENCVANLNGICVANSCRGTISMLRKSKCTDRDLINKFYNVFADNFRDLFADEIEGEEDD